MATFKQGDVLIPFFLLSTGGQGSEQRQVSLTVGQKGRILWGWPLCVIIITKATESKSKKQFQHGVRIDFSLQQLHLQELFFFFGETVLSHLYTGWQQKTMILAWSIASCLNISPGRCCFVHKVYLLVFCKIHGNLLSLLLLFYPWFSQTLQG